MPEKTVTEQIAELLNVEFPPLPDPSHISISGKSSNILLSITWKVSTY
ncbi:MAG: hypothetical protein Q3M30_02780 [Candidatus Electrothrix sp. Rat3]|nr:hypothetical protein [Candidatus Electrothrix rattekaaiensis]